MPMDYLFLVSNQTNSHLEAHCLLAIGNATSDIVRFGMMLRF